MELKINIEDKHDLNILWQILNNAQSRTIDSHAKQIAILGEHNDLFKNWFDETVDEWNRIQSIKRQIQSAIKR